MHTTFETDSPHTFIATVSPAPQHSQHVLLQICVAAQRTHSRQHILPTPCSTSGPQGHLACEEEVTRTIPYKAIMQRKKTQVGAVRTSCKDTLPFSDAAKVYYDGSLVSVEVVHFQVLFCLTSKR